MKKKCIKVLLCSLIIKLICVSNFAQGDVVVDSTAIANNPQAFITYINNAEGNAEAQRAVAESFIAGVSWQMPGYAVFINNNGVAGPVYAAQKRQFVGGNVAQNDNKQGGHVLKYTSNMHTERQLAIVALEEALGNNLPVVKATSGLGPLVNNAKIPLTNENIPQPDVNGKTYSLTGALHIYTGANPCANRCYDNGEFSCIEYYNALATLFPNVDFHIYFRASKMQLTGWFINTNNDTRTADAIKIALLNQLNKLITTNGTIARNFRIRYSMQLLDNNNKWKIIDGSDKCPEDDSQWTMIKEKGNMTNKINNLLVSDPGNSLTTDERETLFNAIHNHTHIKNIYYHAI